MTRKDLTCIHEPFGDAFYFGPERLSTRYEGDEKAREESGFVESTYRTVLEAVRGEEVEVSWGVVLWGLGSAEEGVWGHGCGRLGERSWSGGCGRVERFV